MGKGIDLARADAPEHAQLLDDFKDQLLIVLLKRCANNGKVRIPVAEVDGTGSYLVAFSVRDEAFHFEVRKKQ